MAMQSGHERCRLHSVSRVLRVRAVRARTPLVHARASNSPKQKTSRADALRKLLREPGIHQVPPPVDFRACVPHSQPQWAPLRCFNAAMSRATLYALNQTSRTPV